MKFFTRKYKCWTIYNNIWKCWLSLVFLPFLNAFLHFEKWTLGPVAWLPVKWSFMKEWAGKMFLEAYV